MTTMNPNWGSWTTTSIASSTITNTSTDTTSSAISLDNITAAEVSVTIVYGSPCTEGVKCYLLREYTSSSFESGSSDGSWGFMMPFAVSATVHKTFSVSGNQVNTFKILLTNDTGASVTATVNYITATTDVV